MQNSRGIVPELSFTLDSKDFYATGVEARALLSAFARRLIIVNKDQEGNMFANNADHCFIRGLTEVAPNIFETRLET